MAAFASGNGNHKCTTDISRQKCDEESISRLQEIITPSIVDLTKEVRTNILCTVEGCGKILPNTPALNMHLVKSHRVKDGLVNPTIRKDMAASQRLYCCPIEGCPRGPNRPFSQFSLVKQHFMKMHAEKKHKCSKCNNGYSTEWDLRRHMEDCGKTYCCTCGCPYASRAALLSHIYRTGHEVPTEHRIPPVKKRKMERLLSGSAKGKPKETRGSASAYVELSGSSLPLSIKSRLPETTPPSPSSHRSLQKLLLPKPKMALVNVPVMHLAHVPVLLPSTDGGALRSVVLAVDSHGSLGTLHLLPQALGAVVSQPDAEALGFKDCRAGPVPVSTGVQVSLEEHPGGQRGRSTSTDIQTDVSCLSRGPAGVAVCAEPSASACSQTDISVSAQVLLPVSVETQTTSSSSRAKATSTIAAQTDGLRLSPMPCASSPSFTSVAPYVTRHTQTASEERAQMDRAVMCSQLFDGDSLSVSTQTAMATDDPGGLYGDEEEEKAAAGMCFGMQTDELSSSGVADNQTQTMTLLSDLENILSGHQVLGDPSAGLGSAQDQDQHAGIDFDLEEFLNTVHIQTQTEESELGGLGASLDIQTQTDFLLLDELDQSAGQTRAQATDLELEMFDTQTQTDLNFLLSAGSHMPLGSILRHSSFSMSTESSDTETQTDVPSLPLSLAAQPPVAQSEQARPLSNTETQTMTSQSESLGHLFLTSNETQTAVDDFLSADLAWNMESQLSSVETQTCEELCALFQHSEKPNS